MKKRPTIIDVAQIAGVSKSTVARALSVSGSIDEATRARVLAAIQSSGYERNLVAASMRTGTRHLIGLVVPDVANPYWGDVSRAVQDRAETHGLSVVLRSSDWVAERERNHLQMLRQSGVDGVLLNSVADETLPPEDLPIVFLGAIKRAAPPLACVHSDMQQGISLGLQHLLVNGHRDVALIGSILRQSCPFLTLAQKTWLEMGMDSNRLVTAFGDYSTQSGRAAFRNLQTFGPMKATAILAANDLMAIGSLLEAQDHGFVCPRDVSIIGMDGINAGHLVTPHLTTISKPRALIGHVAVDLLMDIVADASQAKTLSLPCQLSEGGTVGHVSSRT